MRLARGPFASTPAEPTTPTGIPATGRKVRSPGCTLNGSPTSSSPSTGELDPSASCASSTARWSGLRQLPAAKLSRVGALWSARRDGRPCGKRATPPADGGRQVQASMLTGGLVAAHRGIQQPVAEQSGHRPVQLGSGAPAMPVSPRRDYAGKADFCSSSEGSVEATRRHAWGCWA
jgi:hypothetical protein